ncbi:MAG: 2-amino-4-hydroxy-6-hydroxymethyldihydropteridine diphosphokinase [Myxococcota bacterium]|nr:2-amino-4-hydroxy-6-hydroxymethyldihydropteridine diphosphokinase [Myxococcota bacterium]
MKRVLLGLGSSLSDRYEAIHFALLHIQRLADVNLLRVSSLYCSTPLGRAQNLFLNASCVMETRLSPPKLLFELKRIERRVGRRKNKRWADRVIDIDILLMGKDVYRSRSLSIPHPEFLRRSFVLQPSVEIAGDWIHPIENRPIKDLREQYPICWPIGCLPFTPRALWQEPSDL